MMITPRLSGQARSVGQGSTAEKNTRKATPRQISGTTIGNASNPSTPALPGKRKRHNNSATNVPSTRLISVEINAMVSELPNAINSSVSLNNAVYQRVEKPRQMKVRFESLKLKITNIASGVYRNSPTTPSHSRNGQRPR